MEEPREFHFNPVLSLFPKALVGGEVYHSSPASGFGIDRKTVTGEDDADIGTAGGQDGSAGSIQSVGSAGSILSIGSAGSILSIGSAGSILSIGSAGSILSIGSAGSVLSIGSVASVASIGSAFSLGGLADHRKVRTGLVETGATVMAVAALATAVLRR